MNTLCASMVATKGNLFYLDVGHLNIKFWFNNQNFRAIRKYCRGCSKGYTNIRADGWKTANKYTYRAW